MKFSTLIIATLSAALTTAPSVAFTSATSYHGRASAFALEKVLTDPPSTVLSAGPSTDPVDKSLNGIDTGVEYDVFDPLTGSKPALVRNNNDEVWVPQVNYL